MARTDFLNRESQRGVPLWLIIATLTLLAARIVALQVDKHKAEDRSLVHWVDIDDARARATAENKPILYHFTAAWCGPCHALEAEVFEDPTLAKQINDEFIAVRVTDRQREDGANPLPVQELQDRYSVRGFPTVVVADAGGAQQGRMEGYGGRAGFVQHVMERAR